jgi:hypothetical protein
VPLKAKLGVSMTVTQFDNGYWYALELKAFAATIGIPGASKLRKDELETAIRHFLQTGESKTPTARPLTTSGTRDVDRGLRLDLPVVVYTNDRETKSFLEREARKLDATVKRKSGARYRLNRWREEQIANGVRLTYQMLVKEYLRLNRTAGSFPQIPQVRYINFVSDFMAAEKGATRQRVLAAWREVKALDGPKTYRAWIASRSSKR